MKILVYGVSLVTAQYLNQNLSQDPSPDAQTFKTWCGLLKDARNKKVLSNVQETARNAKWRRAISPAIAALVSPDLDTECKDLDENLDENQSTRIDNEVLNSQFCPQPTGCKTLYDMAGIWNYGCWCNFAPGEIMTGSGTPRNEYDAACQKFQLCTRCARFDTKDETECNANTRDFDLGLGAAKCSDANAENCESYLCTCQSQLVSDLLDLMWRNVPYDPLQLHSNPNWDSQVCEITPQGGNMECCGLYPRRFPYNSDKKICCPDGKQVMAFETCA